MNCEEVKANLSPYVAGDIERHGARAMLDAHLRDCAACRALAQEWEASRRLLQLHQPPEFDAAFFDSVRRDVMRRISEPRPSLLTRILGQPFGRRTMTYATAFSLLVCAAVLSSHFLRRTQTPPVEVVKEKDGPGTGETGIAIDKGAGTQRGGTANVNKDFVVSPSPRSEPSPQRRIRRARDGGRGPVAGRKFVSPSPRPDEEQTADARRVRGVAAPESEPKSAAPPNHVETVASAGREMLRIELHTSDPNVRIIWLSPRTTGSASSNKMNR